MPEIPLSEIKQNRRAVDPYVDMEEREHDRRRLPALFYRVFTYKDGRGDVPSEQDCQDDGNDSDSSEMHQVKAII